MKVTQIMNKKMGKDDIFSCAIFLEEGIKSQTVIVMGDMLLKNVLHYPRL